MEPTSSNGRRQRSHRGIRAAGHAGADEHHLLRGRGPPLECPLLALCRACRARRLPAAAARRGCSPGPRLTRRSTVREGLRSQSLPAALRNSVKSPFLKVLDELSLKRLASHDADAVEPGRPEPHAVVAAEPQGANNTGVPVAVVPSANGWRGVQESPLEEGRRPRSLIRPRAAPTAEAHAVATSRTPRLACVLLQPLSMTWL